MYAFECSFVINFLPLFQRFGHLRDIITGCVHASERVRAYVCSCTHVCVYVCACMRNLVLVCMRLCLHVYVFVLAYALESVCLRPVTCVCICKCGCVHAWQACMCMHVRQCVGACVYAFFRGCTTIPGYRRLGKNKKNL